MSGSLDKLTILCYNTNHATGSQINDWEKLEGSIFKSVKFCFHYSDSEIPINQI